MGTDFRLDRRDVRIALLCGAAALVAYLPSLTTWFAADDFLILPLLQRAGGVGHPLDYFRIGFYDQYYRPLALLCLGLDWNLWGLNAAGFHLSNICLHAASTMLVFALGRRFLDLPGAAAAALLFGLHPANHEAVFWIAGRFDLLATFFVLLALLLLFREDARSYALGVACFGLALLSKESALSLPMISASYDVFVRGRTWQTTVKRLIPLLVLMAIYAVLRTETAGLSPVGADRRLPKLAMFAAALAALLLAAWWRTGRSAAAKPARFSPGVAALFAGAVVLVLAGGLLWPAIKMAEKLSFLGYAGFYLLSPVVLPAPHPYFLDPTTRVYWMAGLIVAASGVFAGLRSLGWLAERRGAAFFAAFGVAALVPVSSMTGNPRYLYLASAGVALLSAAAWRSLVPLWRARATAVLALVLAVSAVEVQVAAREWRWASEMTREGLALMARDMEPCGTKDIILLTMPEGGRGVWTNLPSESLQATGQCASRTFVALLRVVHDDATVEVTTNAGGVIDLRVPHYEGNIKASKDLSEFFYVRPAATARIDTPIGLLEAQPDGDSMVFHLRLKDEARQAALFYYSDGRIHPVR